jgi:hypothetical protein
MRLLNIICIILVFLPNLSSGLDIKGQVAAEVRYALEDGELLFNQETGSLGLEGNVNENLFVKTSMRIKYFNNPWSPQGFSSSLTANELGTIYAVQPVEITLDEAYFLYTDFLFPGLDLTVGKQRISWGTADKLNPTDCLNPLDFSDPFDFGRKLPTLAFNLTYYFPELEGILENSFLQLVFEPYSAIARENLLIKEKREEGMASGFLSQGLVYDPGCTFSDKVNTPSLNIKNYLLAGKLGGTLAGFDLGLSYTIRINDLPYIRTISIDAVPNITAQEYTLSYYREHIVGFELAKDLGFVLAWAEAAVFFQEEHKSTTLMNGLPVASAKTVWAEPYVKYTVGFDKSLSGGFYINLQYCHGFFGERGNKGPERLEDYLLLRLEFLTLDDKLKFGLTGLGNINNIYEAFEANDFGDYLSDYYAFLAGFDVEYLPTPNLSIKAGFLLFDGKKTTTLGQYKDMDLFFVKCEYSF